MEEGLAASRTAVEQRPGSAAAHTTLGGALLALSRLEEAAESFRRAVDLDSNYRGALHNMAETRRQQGRFMESMRWYRGVLDIDSEFAPAYAGMAMALFNLGQYEEAVKFFEQAAALRWDARPADTLYLLADALRRQQRYEEAIERYRDVLEIDPGYAASHAGMGYAFLRLGRHEEAIESLARSVSIEPESPAASNRYVAIGRASQELGQSLVAAEHYERALEINPRNTKALDSFAVLRFRQQRYEEALSLYQAFVEIGEANARVHANMGAALYYLDRPDEALRNLDRALSLDPTLAGTGFEGMRDALRQERQ